MFYSVAGLVVIFAILIIVLPIWLRPHGRGSVPANKAISARELLSSRLAELAREKSRSLISSEEYEILINEAAASHLASSVEQDDSSNDGDEAETNYPIAAVGERKAGVSWVFGYCAVVPVLAFTLYQWLGEPDAFWLQEAATAVQRSEPDPQLLQPLSQRLSRRLETNTDDVGSWYLLGLAELQLEKFTKSAAAFKRVDALQGPQVNVDLYWLQARFLAAGGVLDEQSLGIGKRILEQQPNQPVAIEILALAAYRAGQFAEAVRLLNRALSQPLRADIRATLTTGLAESRARLGDQSPYVDVQVATASVPPPGSQVFVIARPVGARMPLAVVRRPAVALPMMVRLDDAVSMNPTSSLSSAEQIEVIVRLSINGQPISAPGDWEWRSEVIDIKEENPNFSVVLKPPE